MRTKKLPMGALEDGVMEVLWADGGWMTPGEIHLKLTTGRLDRTAALLRSLGATRGQVARLFLGEAALFGADGALSGSAGGTLIVEVPNFDDPLRRLFGRSWAYIDVPRHLLHFIGEIASGPFVDTLANGIADEAHQFDWRAELFRFALDQFGDGHIAFCARPEIFLRQQHGVLVEFAHAAVHHLLDDVLRLAGLAREIALKTTETMRLPTLSYSAAEVRHGPLASASAETPLLVLRQNDGSSAMVDALIADLRARKLNVFSVGDPSGTLPWIENDDPICDAITMLLPAYVAIEQAARDCGFDPDNPPSLTKITETL